MKPILLNWLILFGVTLAVAVLAPLWLCLAYLVFIAIILIGCLWDAEVP
jgi:hypothetical protein